MPGMVMAARPSSRTRYDAVIIATLVVYLLARVIEVLPFTRPSTSIVALEILSALVFALVHGARMYGVRGVGVFVTVCLVIGGVMEAIGVRTGFPFGHYEFLPLMGPEILRVPILLGLAYVGMAYASWGVATLLAGARGEGLSAGQAIAVPLLASAVMTGWDFAQDPVWSTLLHAWRWRDGGMWFGVPLTNYAGWLITTSLIYLGFATHLRTERRAERFYPKIGSRAPVVLYGLCAMGNILQFFKPQSSVSIVDNGGTYWKTTSILQESAVVSFFLMGSFALLAWMRGRTACSDEAAITG